MRLNECTEFTTAAGELVSETQQHLATQVAEQANNMATNDAAMEAMTKLIHQLQGEINTLKKNQAGQSTRKPNSYSYKKGNWWSNKYCWNHVIGRNDGEAFE